MMHLTLTAVYAQQQDLLQARQMQAFRRLRAGTAVARVHGHVRERLRARLRDRGLLVLMEAIFIGIYIYGWNRLSPRAHFVSGFPIALAGVTGSLLVISVNGWMNHPSGFRHTPARPSTFIAPGRSA